MTITPAKIEEVFAVFKHAARYGKPCPTNTFVADQLGISESSVRVAVRILADENRMVIELAGMDRRMKVGGYQGTWSTPKKAGGIAPKQPSYDVKYDCREYELALKAAGGRFEDADTRGEITTRGPTSPPATHSTIGCAAAMTAGVA